MSPGIQSTQNNKFAISWQYLKKNVRDEVPADKRQRLFFQTDTIILVFVARYAQITQNNKFDVSLQYFKKLLSNEIDCMQISMKVSYKLTL